MAMQRWRHGCLGRLRGRLAGLAKTASLVHRPHMAVRGAALGGNDAGYKVAEWYYARHAIAHRR